MRQRSIFGIPLWTLVLCISVTTLCPAGHGATLPVHAKAKIIESISFSSGGTAAEGAPEPAKAATQTSEAVARSLSPVGAVAAVISDLKQSTSSTGSQQQVAKTTTTTTTTTAAPTTVKFLKRFNPNDGGTTTINPLLMTLPGGVVQTTEPYVEPTEATTTTTTTARSLGTTRTTTTPAPTTTTQRTTTTTTTSSPVTTTTTTPRPVIITPKPTYRTQVVQNTLSQRNSFGQNKPFNIFDFYLKDFVPMTHAWTTPRTPFVSQFGLPVKSVAPQIKVNQQPIRNSVFVEQKPVPQVTTSTFQNPAAAHLAAVGSIRIPPVEPVVAIRPSIFNNQVAPVTTTTTTRAPITVAAVTTKAPQKPVPALSVSTLAEKVTPPLSSASEKVTLHPKVNVDLKKSNHKFINRFIVEEDVVRVSGPISGAEKLDKEVLPPPTKNVRPILSPRISVHVGDVGFPFLNRFVLTEEELAGNNKNPSKSLLKSDKSDGLTDFTRRFQVDDVNKKLFQIASAEHDFPVRAPQKQIAFNNRFNEGVNTFTFPKHDGPASRTGRVLEERSAPIFNRINLQLPSFSHLRNVQAH